MGSVTTPLSLNVIVVGGGIGGLSAAIALRRAGHHVVVYEKYPADAEAGAGIVVCANAARVLRQWGLDPESVGMLRYKEGLIVDGKTLKLIQKLYGEGLGKGVAMNDGDLADGESQWMTTRKDLRMLLRNEVERDVHGEGSVKIVYGKEAVDYDADRPAVLLDDGSWLEADLVVACDGIHSKAARRICGSENLAMPFPMGFSAFRLLIPSEELEAVREMFKEDEMVRAKFDEDAGRTWFAAGHPGNEQTGKLVVWWLCRFGQIHALDIIIPDNDKYAGTEEWLTRCDKQVLLDEFSQFHPVFPEILKRAEEPLLWKICRREPLETMHKGGLCMLGDALHPMPPYRAQGGSQTIEDAGALEMCLAGMTDKAELRTRLQTLEDLRVPRFGCAQLMSTVRQDEPNFEERWLEVFDKCRKWFVGKDQSHFENREAYQAWMLSYDVRKEAKKAVEQIRWRNLNDLSSIGQ